jgi:glycosyltransferase involved in cell wall biosynthesis
MTLIQPPFFTVVTPNFNTGDRLLRTATSVLEQAEALEYVVADGASKDRSLADAMALQELHPVRVRVSSEPDKGVYDAMNKAIRTARGRYLIFLGAGDTLRQGVLSAIRPHLPPGGPALVYGNVLKNGQPYRGEADPASLLRSNICHQAIFYSRETFDLLGLYDLKYRVYADWEFNIRCFGDRRIVRKHVPSIIADFEAGGLSDTTFDHAFAADLYRLVAKHYGRAWLASHPRTWGRFRYHDVRTMLSRAARKLGVIR